MTRRDEQTIFPDDAARRAHAKEPEDDGPDFQPGDLQPADVAPMGPQPTCSGCGGMVVFSIRPGVWSECRDCGQPRRLVSDVRGERGAA